MGDQMDGSDACEERSLCRKGGGALWNAGGTKVLTVLPIELAHLCMVAP